MIKKLIHLGDLHFRTYKRHDEYKEVLTGFLEEIKTEILGKYKPEEVRIVICGDVVHQKITISNELIEIVAWFLGECADLCPVILIPGNHDLLEDNKDRMDSLTPIINLLKRSNINYIKESKCIEDENIVWCVYSIIQSNQRPAIYDAIKEFGTDKKYVGLYHGVVLGSKTSLGFEFKDSGVGLDYFDGCNMVLLSDIHKHQSFENNGCVLAYSSSSIQQNYGESISGHGYLLWDVETNNFELKELDNNNEFYQFKIVGLSDIDNGSEILINK